MKDDLRILGRIGVYTLAVLWAAIVLGLAVRVFLVVAGW